MSLHLFKDKDFESIRQAIVEAEKTSSGEIVPFAVEASNRYTIVIWRAATLGAFIGLGSYAFYSELNDVWGIPPLLAFLSAFLGAGAGWSLTEIFPSIQRLLVGKDRMHRHVMNRAKRAFLEEEVFATEQRNGILIFVSIFEHEVVVLADSGIHKVVHQSEWEGIVETITSSIRRGAPAEGMIRAIEDCGKLLHRHKLTSREQDANELKDDLRIGKPEE
jgi:putative membrane protein